MISLDYKTLEKLAELICGDKICNEYFEDSECPYYRKWTDIEKFFGNAGLEVIEKHDSRIPFTLINLKFYNNGDYDIEKVILRLADPKEYNGPNETAFLLKKLNDILFAEGFRVVLKGRNPSLIQVDDDYFEDNEDDVNFPEINFESIIKDKDLSIILKNRWAELKSCFSSEAHLSSIILMGSILEGSLLHVIETNEDEAKASSKAPKDKKGIKPLSKWTLYDLISVSHDCNWINDDIKDFDDRLRDYRNLVHPRKQREKKFFPDEDTCNICLQVVKAALNDIKNIEGS